MIVAASPRTLRLLGTIEGIEVVPLEQVPQQNFDVYCPLLSLPRAFGTRLDNIPAQVPYLHADPSETARWNEQIGGGAFRVGIVWAGNPATVRDRFRSPRLSSVAPLFSTPGVDFVVLQVGPGRSDCDAMPLPPHVLDLGNEVTDLTDTAAIMAGLDLMISSCTGPLHLAGALGVPTWAMIPFAPHFPWRLEHTDTAWYPTMRLYRQEQFGQDWSGVVGRIGVDLVAMAQSKLDLQRTAAPPRDVPPASATKATSDGSLGQTIGLPRQQAPETEGFNELAHCRGALMLFNRNDIHIGACLRKYGEFSYGESKLFRQRNYFLRFQRLKATSSYYIVTNDLTNVCPTPSLCAEPTFAVRHGQVTLSLSVAATSALVCPDGGPADVREIIGRSVFKVPTGHTDEHRAATVAAPIIAELQDRIRSARDAGKRLEQVTAEISPNATGRNGRLTLRRPRSRGSPM